ncbi:MAG: leucine-rich repeat protein [Bacteroidales bacterium]|nr:leucine-rich repeat protein [Bacteroidales bacterium]
MKQLLTILFTTFFAQAIFAQTTITIQAENAAEKFAKLSVGEYNIVVKGDLKGKNEWYYDENNHKPIGMWKIENISYRNFESLKINILDLSGVIGLDSIKSDIIYAMWYYENQKEFGAYYEFPPISKLILPDNMVYFNTSEAFKNVDEVIVSPNSKNFKMQDKFLLSKDGKELYYYKFTSGTSLQIPDGVEKIKYNSICGWSDDTDTIEVNLSKSVKELDSNCFKHDLFQMVIPKNVKNISTGNYHNIRDISKDNKYYTMENGVIYNKDKTTLLYVGNIKGTFVIPSGVKKIEQYVFYKDSENEDSVESIVLPETLEFIDSRACSYAYRMTSVNIPKSVKWIGCYNFKGFDIKEIGDANNWYFTTNEADWLKRQNGVPVSVILQEKDSENGDNLNQILEKGIWYKRTHITEYDETMSEDNMEYASWYDPKKSDIKEPHRIRDVESLDGGYEEIFFMCPFFYKLD